MATYHTEARAFVAANPVGKTFEILFNPADPLEILNDGQKNPNFGRIWTTLGVGAIVIGLINIVVVAPVEVSVMLASVALFSGIVVGAITDYPFEQYLPLEAGRSVEIQRRESDRQYSPTN